MVFSRVKNLRINEHKYRRNEHIYSQKRISISILVSTVLLFTSITPASLAVEINASNSFIPALCDPNTLPVPVTINPTPEASPTADPSSTPETSPTPDITVTPTPTPSEEVATEVPPDIPAAELSASIIKAEEISQPKVVCPSPVTNVSVKSQNTQLAISWSAGINTEPNTIENITDYYVKVLETAQVIKLPSDKTSTIISGLTNGSTYSIVIYAASEFGSSIASDLVTAIPLSGNEGEVAGIIVEFKPEANVEQGQLDVPGEELVSQVELTIENKITEDVHVVEFSEATTLEEAKTIANEISQDPQVVWAEPDQFVYTSSQEVINDPNYSTDQWNLWDKYGIGIGQSNTEMTTAWSLTAGQGINVAVIDTGITSHPDLDSQVIPGFDFVSDPEFLKASREENGSLVSFDGDYINSEKYGSLGWDDNPQDPGDWRGITPVRNSTWHGTHIAGVIAAQSENQEGIAGIAPGAKIQPIRALSWRGGLLSDIATSITWASGGSVTGVADNPNPAKVINMSFSVNSVCPTSLQTAINDAFARGSVLVAAAGNNNDDVKNYAPANCENVISVGASNKDGKRASYSNYGLGIDVSAPGGDANDNGIYSTANTGLTEPASFGYASQQGTSISAAHVSAIAARIFSANPSITPTDVKSQIINKESVREFADTQCDINADIYCGEGIVSLFQVAAACSPTPSTSGNYTILSFTTPGSCTWTPNSAIPSIEYLIVAGGGGGSGRHAGGGGAGGFTESTASNLSGAYTIVVGAGGSGSPLLTSNTSTASTTSEKGGNSSVTGNNISVTSVGGGAGSGRGKPVTATDIDGGSGGGSDCASCLKGTGIAGQGFSGGQGVGGEGLTWSGGGGGGAGGAGAAATSGVGGNGGVGKSSSISGVSVTYAGGGGGATYAGTSAGTGGLGGGGKGGNGAAGLNATGFGSGGGGAGHDASIWAYPGGNGSSGIVILRYITPPTISGATISGTQQIGATLTATPGTITGTSPTTSYQWQFSNDGTTNWTDIASATGSTYLIAGTTYRNKYLRVGVTVTNSGGSDTKYSASTSSISDLVPFLSYNASDLNSYTSTGSSITDLSGNAYTSTISGTVSYLASSYAWNFTGGYIDVPNIRTDEFASKGVTVDFEADFGTANTFERIFDFSESGPGNDNLLVTRDGTTSDLRISLFNGATLYNCTYGGGIRAGLNRYTISLDKTNCKYWINGAASPNYQTSFPYALISGITWTTNYIGKSNWSADAAFNGQIRSFRLYAGGYSPAEIDAFSYKTLTYDANGGVALSPTSATTSGKLQLPAATTRTGYTFQGWYDGNNYLTANKLGNASAQYSPSATGTVYAGWSLDAPTITSSTITGTQNIGNTLTASVTTTGTGFTPTYQWQSSDDGSTNWTNISGATASTLALSDTTYRGKYLRYTVTASNSTATVTATSAATSQIYYITCSVTPSSQTINGVARTIYRFTTVQTCDWVTPNNASYATVLVAGGGGGGGGAYDNGAAGGGGGGQVKSEANLAISGVITLTVGDGGNGGAGGSFDGANGSASSFTSLTSLGGSGGYHSRNAPGGSGVGGAAATSISGGGGGNGGGFNRRGGGGGGSVGAGVNSGSGGTGTTSSITGTSTSYGDGGAGGFTFTTATGSAGTSNTGDGGNGASSAMNYIAGGKGGSGVVIVSIPSAPTISSISPSSGPLSGTSVTITGTNFVSGQTTATINAISLTGINVSSSTTMTATIPTLASGTYNLVVNNGGGSATSAYSVLPLPTIESASISGSQRIGSTISASAGVTTGASLTTSYQWQYSDDNSTWTNISGAINASYLISGITYRGKYLRAAVTVTNGGGSAIAYSPATSLIYYPACSTSDSSFTSNGITYTVKQFLNTGTCDFTVPANTSKLNYLVVAGGGGGGRGYATAHGAGGGGAGGYRTNFLNETSGRNSATESAFSVTENVYTVVVGAGGTGQVVTPSTSSTDPAFAPTNGGNSSFGAIEAIGGGRGSNYYNYAPSIGGSGGGGAISNDLTRKTGAAGTSNQGFGGGNAQSANFDKNAGGGGGAGSIGGDGTSSGPGSGGTGLASTITGTSITRAVGGSGGNGTTSTAGTSASANTGNGGGGGSAVSGVVGSGGNGGSGIVVVAYASAPTVSSISPATGAVTGNVSVTITGTNFTADSTVTIGGVSLTSVSVLSGTSITGTISANSLTTGVKDVVVTNSSTASTGGTGLYQALTKTNPTISGFTDTSALFSDATKSITAPTASVAGSFSYSSSDTSVASFASASTSTATLNKVGTATITATFTPTDTSLYNTVTSTITLTVSQGNQSALSITSINGTYGTALTLETSGGTGLGSVTYSVSRGTATSCTLSGSSLTAGSVGTCLVTATKASTTNYLAISSSQTTITFAQASQNALTISTTTGTYGTALSLLTTGGSGTGSLTFVAAAGTASSCSISGSTLTAGSGGTCFVTATKAASTNYNAISSSQTTITFNNKSVTLSSFNNISNKYYGDSTFNLTAPTVADSIAGTFSYASSDLSVATISGSTVTIIGAGSSTITATFSPTESTKYDSQTITMTLTVNKKAITVTAADQTKTYGTSTPTNSFTSSTLVGSDAISGLTYTYSGTNSTTAPTTVGNYTITPSTATFSSGSANNYSITYNAGAYSITKATPTFSGFNNVSKTFGDNAFSLTAPTVTGSVAGSFSYASSDTSVITISSSTATIAAAGSSLITATFTPTDLTNYNSATTSMTITVAKANQSTLSITSASSVNYGSTLSLTAPGGSGTGALTFAVTSGTCSISSTTLTPGNAGSTCVIQATKAASTNYNVATSSTQTITINKINQTISFTSTAPTSPVSGDTYTPSATATSGATPIISIDAASSSICEINAGIVTFKSSGSCVINADSTSSTNYNAATTLSQTITVAKKAQTITFAQPTDSNFGDSNRTMTATSNSGLAVSYTAGAATTNSACTVSSSGVVSILAVGNCEVSASQSGNGQYSAAVTVSRTFAVNAIVPSAPFLTSVSVGNSSATVSFTAPASNGGATISAYELVAIPSTGTNVTKSDCSASASPLACSITGLTNGTSYTFKVAAKNSAGTSAYSTISGSFIPVTVANAVENLVAQPGDQSLTVSFNRPSDLGGGSFTRYDIYYKSGGSYSLTPDKQLLNVSDNSWTFTGLTNGTSYDVKVVAITSANGTAVTGNTAEVSQYPSTAPSAPTNVSVAKLTATSARISWGLPLSDGGAALDATTPYVVTITGGPTPIICGSLSGRSCDITGLTPATTYSVSVTAKNRMGEGLAGTSTYLVPSDDAKLLSLNLQTGSNLSALNNASFSPSFDANTTSYSISVANTDFYSSITPSVNEATATIKINGVAATSNVARNLSLGIGSNVFTIEVTAGDLTTTKTYSLTITRPKASQLPLTISSTNSVNYGNTFTLTTTGGSGIGLVSFATTGTCTTAFSGGNYILTPGDVGTSCSIVATKATDDDYFEVSSSSQTITVAKTTPTLSSFANISKTFGDPSFSLTSPSVSAGIDGTFSYSSSNTSVATVSGSSVTIIGAGTATITASFTPTSTTNYNSTTISLEISVAKKALRVTPTDKSKFYGASHPAITKSVIGLVGSDEIASLSYTYEGSSFAASTTNPEDAGTYSITPTITALTSGSLNNYQVTYDTSTLTISKVNQSALSITSLNGNFGSTLSLITSGGSGNGGITYSVTNGSATSCSVTDGILSATSAGTCFVTATKAASTNFNSASSSATTVSFTKVSQAAFSVNSDSKAFGINISLATTGGSGDGATTYSVSNGTASGCSVTGNTLTSSSAGTCLVSATKAESINYNAITSTQRAITFLKATQSALSISSTSGTYGAAVNLATSGGTTSGPISYVVSDDSASGCSESGGVLTSTSAGDCFVTATMDGSDSYEPVETSRTRVTFAKATQAALSVDSASGIYGATVSLSVTGGSGTGAVTYSASDKTAGINCLITDNNILSADNAGICYVTATKASSTNYNAKSSTQIEVNFAKATQALIEVDSTSGTYGSTIALAATGGSGDGAITYSVSDGTASSCSITGNTLSTGSAGTCLVTATRASSTNYNAKSSIQKAINFAKANQAALSITSTNGTFNSNLTLRTSGGTTAGLITFVVSNGSATGCSESGGELISTSAGTCFVTATLEGSDSYEPVESSRATISFAKASQAALSISTSSATFGLATALSAAGGSGDGEITYSVADGTATGCAISGDSLTSTSAGNCLVTATKADSANYNAKTSSQSTITINKANQVIAFTNEPTSTKPKDTFTPVVTSKHSTTNVSTGITPLISIDPDSTGICSISDGVITFETVGTCIINAQAESSDDYESAVSISKTITITNPVSNASAKVIPTPTPSPSAGVRPNAQRPIIRNVVETPQNSPEINAPELRPIFPSRQNPGIPNTADPGLAITDNIGRLPKSELGQQQISVDGNFLPVREYITSEQNFGFTIPASVNVAPIDFILETTDVKGQNIPASDDGIMRAVKGQTITISGEGLTPGSTFSAWLFSTPTKLGEGKVSADSSFEKVFLIPDELPSGEHTLQINGINSDKKVVSLTTGVIVTEVKQIQTISNSNSELIAYSIIFIFLLLFIIAFLLRYIRRLQIRGL